MIVKAHTVHRDSRIFERLLYAILIFAAAIYYFLLAMDGLNLFKPLELAARGMVFNSMLEHLLHGEFDVDPSAIAFEGSLRDGKTYTYFGIVPALLRLPLLPTGTLAWLDVTGPYCALAATVALCFKLASVVLINNQLPRNRLQATTFFVVVLSLLLGGAQIQFLRGTLYQETLEWAGAISAAFIYCALRGLVAKRKFSVGLIAGMASLAGLSLLTRVSTALGLYVAIGLLIAALAWPSAGSLRDRMFLFFRGLTSRRTVVGFAILLSFVVLAGVVNYQRWGNPLEFYYDPRTYIGYMTAPWRLARLEAYGVFNIERLWYGIVYYFFPIWTISRPDGQFLFAEFETRMIDAVETPQSSFLLSDPLLLVLAGAYLLRLPRLVRDRLLDLACRGRADDRSFGTCVSDIDIHVHGLQVPDGVLSISRILGLSWILCDLRESHRVFYIITTQALPDPDCQCCIWNRLFAFCAPPPQDIPSRELRVRRRGRGRGIGGEWMA